MAAVLTGFGRSGAAFDFEPEDASAAGTTGGRWPDGDATADAMVEAYWADLDRILATATDESRFLERTSALDRQYLEAWFVRRFGSSNADPMQAFRQAPAGGVVRRATPGGGAAGGHLGRVAPAAPAPEGALAAQVSETHRRHVAFLEERAGALGVQVAAHSHPIAGARRATSPLASHRGFVPAFGRPADDPWPCNRLEGLAGHGARAAGASSTHGFVYREGLDHSGSQGESMGSSAAGLHGLIAAGFGGSFGGSGVYPPRGR